MADDGSVAPKERVNIRYRPATGDAREEIELPLKHLILGDFTSRPDDASLEERERIDINKDNFNDVMRGLNLAVDASVDDRLSDDPDARLSVHLEFDSLKDFEPERVVNQVPELRKLLELRQALVALKGPLGNTPRFRKAIQSIIDDEGARSVVLEELGIGETDKDR